MRFALTGNPNSGKTTMYNALTGRNEKVGNWAGVTVDKKEHPLKKSYGIEDVVTDDEELNAFLFSLGCYSGEPITVIQKLKAGCVVSIKDGRYNIDNQLAEAIIV